MAIQISTTKPQIQLNISKPSISLNQPKGDLKIKQVKAELKIKTENAKISIDQYNCFAEAGLKNYKDLMKQYTQLGRRKALEGITKIVSEGNMMSDIRKGNPSAIPQIAKWASWGSKRDYNFSMIPLSRPDITIIKGDFKVNWELGGADIKYTPKKVQVEFNRGRIKAYVNQKPSFQMKYLDERA